MKFRFRLSHDSHARIRQARGHVGPSMDNHSPVAMPDCPTPSMQRMRRVPQGSDGTSSRTTGRNSRFDFVSCFLAFCQKASYLVNVYSLHGRQMT